MSQIACVFGSLDVGSTFAEFDAQPTRKWNKPVLSWFFKETPESQRNGMPLADIYADIMRALRHWRLTSKLRFLIQIAANEQEADLVIQMTDVPPSTTNWISWKPSVLAVGHYPLANIGRIAGDIYVNAKNYIWRSFTEIRRRGEPFKGIWYDFFSMIIHELGHTFGLGHSPNEPKAIMYPTYHLMREPLVMPTDDVNGMVFLYGKNEMSQGFKDREAWIFKQK